MSLCSCKLKSGDRIGQQCNAKVKNGKFCGRHSNCVEILHKQEVCNVILKIRYNRSSDDDNESDPSAKDLERYVSKSEAIPENIIDIENYNDFKITSTVKYIGNCKFSFACKTDLKPNELADLFLLQNMADGAWGSAPGNGSFVYPTKEGHELGLLSYESVVVNGKKFMKKKFMGF